MVRTLCSLAGLALVFVLAFAPPGRSDGVSPQATTAPVSTRMAWLLARQAKDGRFGVDPAHRVLTTALVVLGLSDRRLGSDGPRKAALARAIDHLIDRQDASGAFREQSQAGQPGVDRTLLGLLALFAYQDDDGSRVSAGLALVGEEVAAVISTGPPRLTDEPTDEELVRVALSLGRP